MHTYTVASPVVISIGGSLLFKDGSLDTDFLQKLNAFIRAHVARGMRFMLVAGGGSICRSYQNAAQAVIHDMSHRDLDWLGIHSTRLNGHLLRTIFVDIAHPRMIENYERKLENWIEPIVIGAGWKPGWSTDYCAVSLAKDYGARVMVNLSNIEYVFDGDPRTNPNAAPLQHATWDFIHTLVGDTWKPGMNTPFDPIATQLASEINLDVIVAHGANFANLDALFGGLPFVGTIISRA